MTPRVKICCIKSKTEALMAFRNGADAIGLVSKMPSGPGIISPDRIREITRIIPPSIDGFVLTALTDSWDLINLIRELKNRTIQLVDKLGLGNYAEIRSSIPCVKIVQVVHVTGEEALVTALKVDDWALSRQIVDYVESPVFLAGGLNADNVTEAIETVRPFGVDVCNGVRTNDKLDPEKLNKFISIVKRF